MVITVVQDDGALPSKVLLMVRSSGMSHGDSGGADGWFGTTCFIVKEEAMSFVVPGLRRRLLGFNPSLT